MSKVMDLHCPTCRAVLHYNAKLKKFKCDSCGNEYIAEDLKSTKKEDPKGELDVNYVTYNCPDCGAQIVADDQTAATFCLYCGNTAILKNKLSGQFAPSMIIPFQVDKDRAIEAFKKLGDTKPFIPNSFNSEKNIEKITGLYVPFWLYEIGVEGEVDADAKNVTSWRIGDVQYTKTDSYKVAREGKMKFARVPVDGSTRFDNNVMNSIEPFNYEGLIPYDHAYLSGFFAERYDITDDKLFNEAADRAINSAKQNMLDDMKNYTTKVVTKNSLVAKKDKVEYVLLPVWMVNVKYQDKYYLFAMNGQTGEFIGDVPIDKGKAFRKMSVCFAIAFIILLIVTYIMFKLGGL